MNYHELSINAIRRKNLCESAKSVVAKNNLHLISAICGRKKKSAVARTITVAICQRNPLVADILIFATAVSWRYSEIFSRRFRTARNLMHRNSLIISKGIFSRL